MGVAVSADEALLPRLLLTSCCVAQFLTDHELVLVCGPEFGGLETLVSKDNKCSKKRELRSLEAGA